MNKKYTLNSEDDIEKDSVGLLGFTVRAQQSHMFTVHINEDIKCAAYYSKIFDMLLDAGEDDIVNIFISSPGGDLDGLNVLLEGIRMTDAFVRAILIGCTHSAASILALNCHDVVVTDSATALIHCPRTGYGGKQVDLESYTSHSKRISDKLIRNTYTGFLSEESISEVLAGRELWLDADQIRDRLEQRAKYFTEGLTKEDNAEAERTPDIQPQERRSKSKKVQ